MSIVTVAQAKAQSRVLQDIDDELFQAYLDAAEAHAQLFLNRNVYADAPSLAAAQATLPALTTAFAAADLAAVEALQALETFPRDFTYYQAKAQIDVNRREAWSANNRIMYGMVITPNYVQAIVLIVASWYVNRETVVTEFSQAIELPWGAQAMLSPMKKQMGV